MSHPDCAPVYCLLGMNAKQAMTNGFIADNDKRYIASVRHTKKAKAQVDDSCWTITQAILTGAVPSPARRTKPPI